MEKKSYKLRKGFAGILLVVSTSIAVLTGCCNKGKTNNTSTPTKPIEVTIDPTEEITPTIEVTPTEAVVTTTPTNTPIPTATPTPTAIPTPTNTPVPTATPTPINTPIPTPKPEERKISYEDLTSEEVVMNNYFGEEEDFDTEVEKRTKYFKSFGISEDYTRSYLACINMNNPESTLKCTENDIDNMEVFIDKLCAINNKNPNNQCLLSAGAIGEKSLTETEKLVINAVQRDMVDAVVNKKFSGRVNNFSKQTRYYFKDSVNPIDVVMNDLSDVCKAIATTTIWKPFSNIPRNSRSVEMQGAMRYAHVAYESIKESLKELMNSKTLSK